MELMAVDPASESEIELEEEDLEKLESDVKQMAKKISDYRETLPEHLRNTFDSALSSHRPVLPNIRSGSDPLRLTPAGTEVPSVFGTEEKESREKIIQLKERTSKNFAAIPRVLKRMRECIESMDKLDSVDVTIHPAFRRPRTN